MNTSPHSSESEWGDQPRALVTGAAGFIGSRVAGRLRSAGVPVVGVDTFDPYYGRRQKESNLAALRADSGFELREGDLSEVDLVPYLRGVTHVFHCAAQAGVRGSWASGFGHYVTSNIVATQRLLEAVREAGVTRFVYSSSSSVYGDITAPVDENAPTNPRSPYGATKLAAEHLCGVYAREFGVPCVSLRYFTVFGPGQRPDMAFHRMIEAALTGVVFPMFGDGSARRDFTFVEDVVSANIRAALADVSAGAVYNIGGGDSRTVSQVLDDLERIIGTPVPIRREARQAGDVKITAAITDRARDELAWTPSVSWDDALTRQVEWHRNTRDVLDNAEALGGVAV